jgi:hypothetical protein
MGDLAFAKSRVDDFVADCTAAGQYEVNDLGICCQNVSEEIVR